MFRTIAILFLLVCLVVFLWPTVLEGGHIARAKFRKMYGNEEPPKKDNCSADDLVKSQNEKVLQQVDENIKRGRWPDPTRAPDDKA